MCVCVCVTMYSPLSHKGCTSHFKGIYKMSMQTALSGCFCTKTIAC